MASNQAHKEALDFSVQAVRSLGRLVAWLGVPDGSHTTCDARPSGIWFALASPSAWQCR
jgi:hypothetical protein